jgi:serine/threonine protein kinase
MICCLCETSLAPDTERCTGCGGRALLSGTEAGQGPYRLEEVMGKVVWSTTYRATRLSDLHPVCIKALELRAPVPPEARALLVREAQVLRQLSHPQIPAYLGSFISAGGGPTSFCLVRELVEGVDLRQELEGTRHREDEILRVLLSLLDVIDYLHGLRPPVIHRDIKPTNVLRRAHDGKLMLVDFGAVRDAVCDELALDVLALGCLGYLAPEQYEGKASTVTDLYALGVLGVELLSRRDPADMLEAHRLIWRPHVEAHETTIRALDALLRGPGAERVEDAAAARRLIVDALQAQPRREPIFLR